MKINNLKNIFYLFLLTIIMVNCNGDDTGADFFDAQTIPELVTDSPFVRFPTTFAFPATISLANPQTGALDPSVATIDIELSEANGPGTVSRYSLTMNANLSDGLRVVEDFIVVEEFPATITISATNIAEALDIDPNTLNFGNSFNFIGTAVSPDGRVAIGTPPSVDGDTGILGSGNVDNELVTELGNNGAMNFGFTFACPQFDVIDAVGTYQVDTHSYVTNFGLVGDDPIEVTIDPNDENKLILSPILSAHNGGLITITVDGSTGAVTYTEDPSETVFDDFGLDGSVGSVTGLVLPCADLITLSIVPSCCVANTLILRR